jgi:hypothetical protein
MLRRLADPISFWLASSWWMMTIVADLIVAPAIFRVVENFFNAGDLAMLLFSKITVVEMIVASLVLALSVMIHKSQKSTSLLIIFSICWVLTLFYVFYLIPKIVDVAEVWKKSDSLGLAGMGDIKDAQQEHQFFHRMFIVLDGLKLSLLSMALGLRIFRKPGSSV